MSIKKNSYFKKEDTIYKITEEYSETLPVFLSNGFPQMEDDNKRKTLGNSISIKQALLLKGKSYDIFEELLISAIESNRLSEDSTLNKEKQQYDENSIFLLGALPCPVRIPLLEFVQKFSKTEYENTPYKLIHELKAASEGAAWMENRIKSIENPNELPDIFISAGFETFFSDKGIGKFKKDGVFKNRLPFKKFNTSFDNINLEDPKEHYSIISVVPAVFLVNTKELGDLPIPKTWEDLLKPCYENKISIPVGDFDLFASLLLNIHKKYGEEGVRKLSKSMLSAMHPSQMVKSEKNKNERPAVTIMPYFFTKIVKEGGTMQAVWPEDGAIISPIFMLTKANQEKSQSLINALASDDVAKILSHQGLFPSTNPNIENRLDIKNKFMWLGWEYIYENNIPELIEQCIDIFNE